MDNIVEVVTLLRRQSELELQLINGDGTAVATEHALEAVRRRLAAIPKPLTPHCRPLALCVDLPIWYPPKMYRHGAVRANSVKSNHGRPGNIGERH